MPAHSLTLAVAVAAIAFSLVAASRSSAVASRTLDDVAVAQAETEIDRVPVPRDDDPAGVLEPEVYPTTPSEVEACMETWDPETGMSQADYRKSCERTLKYFPQNP